MSANNFTRGGGGGSSDDDDEAMDMVDDDRGGPSSTSPTSGSGSSAGSNFDPGRTEAPEPDEPTEPADTTETGPGRSRDRFEDPVTDSDIRGTIRESAAEGNDFAPSQYSVTGFNENDSGELVPEVALRGGQPGDVDGVPGEFREQIAGGGELAKVDGEIVVEAGEPVEADFGRELGGDPVEAESAAERRGTGFPGRIADPVEAGSPAARRGSGFPGRLAGPAEPTGAEQQQREDFRNRAADRFDVAPDDVEITEDDGTLTAEPALTEDQRFLDGVTGGFAGDAIERGQNIARNAADTALTGAVTPAVVTAGAVGEAADRAGVEAPDVESPTIADAANAPLTPGGVSFNDLSAGVDVVQTEAPTLADAANAPLTPGGVSFNNLREANDEINATGRVVEFARTSPLTPGGVAFEDLEAGVDEVESPDVKTVRGRTAGEAINEAAGTFVERGRAGLSPLGTTAGATGAAVEAGGFEANTDDVDVGTEEALAAGAVGVVTPEPTTSIGGAALAGGAILAGGAVALNERNEIDTPEDRDPITTELDVGTGDVEAAELGVPDEAGATITELDVGTDDVEATEFDTPSDGSRTTEVDVPTVEATGIIQEIGEEELEDEEDFIGGDDIVEPIDDTGETARQTFEQNKFVVEEEYGEEIFDSVPEREIVDEPGPFEDIDDPISGVGQPETAGEQDELFGERFQRMIEEDDVTQVQRQAIRFPADETASTGLASQVEAQGFEGTEPASEGAVETGIGSTTDPFAGVRNQNDARLETAAEAEADATGTVPGIDTALSFEAQGFEASTTTSNVFQQQTVEAQGFEATTTTTNTQETTTEFTDNTTNRRRREPRFGLSGDELEDLDDIGQSVEAETFEFEIDLPDFIR